MLFRSDDIVRKTVILSERYITDRFLPDKAIDLLDESCACAALRNKSMGVTGYTCSDLFEHEILLNAAKQALFEIAEETKEIDALVFVGAPLAVDGKLYNVATAMNQGKILGLTSKTFLPNYGEFYEMRQFTPGPKTDREILVNGEKIPFGPNLLFQANEMEELVV